MDIEVNGKVLMDLSLLWMTTKRKVSSMAGYITPLVLIKTVSIVGFSALTVICTYAMRVTIGLESLSASLLTKGLLATLIISLAIFLFAFIFCEKGTD
jgi:hypothetical protein